MIRPTIALVFLAALAFAACEPQTTSVQVTPVEVADDGTRFEPPVHPEQLPAGVWFCDMGTVHYARHHKGDGKCPVCGMMLEQKP